MRDDRRGESTPGAESAEVEIVVNGEEATVPEGTSVEGFLRSRDLHPRTVAVERNGAIVPGAEYGGTELEAGDRLEVVRFVQGG